MMLTDAVLFVRRGFRYLLGPAILVLLVVVLSYATAALMTAIVLQDVRYARQEYVAHVLEEMRISHAAIMENSYHAARAQEAIRQQQVDSLKLFILEAEFRGLDMELSRVRAQIMPSRDYLSELLARRNRLATQISELRGTKAKPPTGGKP